MTDLDASTDLLIGQWQSSPRLLSAISAPVGVVAQDAMPAFDALLQQWQIASAQGIWLDFLGLRLGIRRPDVHLPAVDNRFGFDSAGNPFDTQPFLGVSESDALYAMPDAQYRRIVLARGLTVTGPATFGRFRRAALILDPSATVTDNRNMTVTVRTTMQTLFEAADRLGALPRPATVELIYSDPSRFGFDTAGSPFDQGPLTPITYT